MKIKYYLFIRFREYSEANLLFPNLYAKSPTPIEKPVERTLALIRPSAYKLFKGSFSMMNV